MSDHEHVSDGFTYADPHEPIDYPPFRQDYVLPKWKDSKGQYPRIPPRDVGTARQTDKEMYFSKDVMREEWRKIWSKSWLWAGHVSDLPKPNSFMKVDRGPESVLVVRKEDGTLSAVFNFCQHRGAQLVLQDFGVAKKFVCPFHRWEFANTGELLKIEDRETFRAEALCNNLDIPKVRVETWRGWIFINFDKDAVSLEEFLGPEIPERAQAYEFGDLVRIRDAEQVWPCNWKTAREIFHEGYHVQATHPQFRPAVDAYHAQIELFDSGHAFSVFQFMSPCPQFIHNLPDEIAEEHKIFLREAGVPEADWPRTWQEVPEALVAAKKDKKIPIDYSRFTEGQLIDDWNAALWPSTEMFFHPEGYFVQHWLPHPSDPEKCIYQVQVYGLPGMTELPSFMGVEDADLSGTKTLPRTYLDPEDMEGLGPVIKQDRAMVERLQRAHHSQGFAGATYSEQEARIRHFHNTYFQEMGREPPR